MKEKKSKKDSKKNISKLKSNVGKKLKSIKKPKIKIKDPTKAGHMAFLIMFIGCALLLGSIITLVILNFIKFDQDGVRVNSSEDGIEIVVTQQENAIINVVKTAKNSVVSIAVTQLSYSPEKGIIDQSSNIGTGFIVDSSGIIVTNQHVVSSLEGEYKVVTSDGSEFDVTEIQRDSSNDIAVLKVEAKDLPALNLGNSDAILPGQTVIAIGTPLGSYAGSVTTGVVSGLDRDVTASAGWFGSTPKTYENVIQTDAAVNPGNSGGPLLNTSGEVIGVNFATTAGADNISFALPINIVNERIEEYRTYGKFIKPYLGVSYQMISEYQALYYENIVAGALVVRVDPYGPAQKAGIKRGDIITYFGQEKVDQSFSSMISDHKVGEEVELKVWSEGEEHLVKVKLVEQN